MTMNGLKRPFEEDDSSDSEDDGNWKRRELSRSELKKIRLEAVETPLRTVKNETADPRDRTSHTPQQTGDRTETTLQPDHKQSKRQQEPQQPPPPPTTHKTLEINDQPKVVPKKEPTLERDPLDLELLGNDEDSCSDEPRSIKVKESLVNGLFTAESNQVDVVQIMKDRLAEGRAIDAFDAFTHFVHQQHYQDYHEFLVQMAISWWSALSDEKRFIDTEYIDKFRDLIRMIYESKKKMDGEFWEKIVFNTRGFIIERNVRHIKKVMFGLREALKDIRKFIIEAKSKVTIKSAKYLLENEEQLRQAQGPTSSILSILPQAAYIKFDQPVAEPPKMFQKSASLRMPTPPPPPTTPPTVNPTPTTSKTISLKPAVKKSWDQPPEDDRFYLTTPDNSRSFVSHDDVLAPTKPSTPPQPTRAVSDNLDDEDLLCNTNAHFSPPKYSFAMPSSFVNSPPSTPSEASLSPPRKSMSDNPLFLVEQNVIPRIEYKFPDEFELNYENKTDIPLIADEFIEDPRLLLKTELPKLALSVDDLPDDHSKTELPKLAPSVNDLPDHSKNELPKLALSVNDLPVHSKTELPKLAPLVNDLPNHSKNELPSGKSLPNAQSKKDSLKTGSYVSKKINPMFLKKITRTVVNSSKAS